MANRTPPHTSPRREPDSDPCGSSVFSSTSPDRTTPSKISDNPIAIDGSVLEGVSTLLADPGTSAWFICASQSVTCGHRMATRVPQDGVSNFLIQFERRFVVLLEAGVLILFE